MNNNLCFVINNKELYFEKCLVDYDMPIFYTCIDNGRNRYVVLCCDSEEMRYFVAKSQNGDIFQMLDKKITMKQIFEKAQIIWEISIGDNFESDKNVIVKFEDINPEDLPVEDSIYEIASNDIKEYYELIKCECEGYKLKNYTKIQPQMIWYLKNTSEYNVDLMSDVETYTFIKKIERKKSLLWDSLFYRSVQKLNLDWESELYLDNVRLIKPKVFKREVSCCGYTN